jgi:hypothetical protein
MVKKRPDTHWLQVTVPPVPIPQDDEPVDEAPTEPLQPEPIPEPEPEPEVPVNQLPPPPNWRTEQTQPEEQKSHLGVTMGIFAVVVVLLVIMGLLAIVAVVAIVATAG